jgi:hypothetical protein
VEGEAEGGGGVQPFFSPPPHRPASRPLLPTPLSQCPKDGKGTLNSKYVGGKKKSTPPESTSMKRNVYARKLHKMLVFIGGRERGSLGKHETGLSGKLRRVTLLCFWVLRFVLLGSFPSSPFPSPSHKKLISWW